jgi:hypothetical protein
MRPGWRRSPDAASCTGSVEERWSTAAKKPGPRGCRCWTTASAARKSAGNAPKIWPNAGSPPPKPPARRRGRRGALACGTRRVLRPASCRGPPPHRFHRGTALRLHHLPSPGELGTPLVVRSIPHAGDGLKHTAGRNMSGEGTPRILSRHRDTGAAPGLGPAHSPGRADRRPSASGRPHY